MLMAAAVLITAVIVILVLRLESFGLNVRFRNQRRLSDGENGSEGKGSLAEAEEPRSFP